MTTTQGHVVGPAAPLTSQSTPAELEAAIAEQNTPENRAALGRRLALYRRRRIAAEAGIHLTPLPYK